MILLDTHIWIWYVAESDLLPDRYRQIIEQHREDGLAVSVISCWEVAKLVERGRLELDRDVLDWITLALKRPDIRLIELTPEIAVTSTQLPGTFHADPADQIIVATAREYDMELLTVDAKITGYEHVSTPDPV